MGARICPRCSTRVDERRAKTSPFCLSCGAPLGAPSPTFSGKSPVAGGSALPWILGIVGVLILLGIGGVIVLVVVSSGGDAKPEPVAVATAAPRVETPDAAPAALASGAPSSKASAG